jgi:outer membrane lipoprotein-sorting protein
MLAKSVRAGILLVILLTAGCAARDTTRPYREPPPANIKAERVNYVDSDAFDVVLETALTNQEPVILIQTSHQKPDWGGRLNGWIAAWNAGGKVDAGKEKRTVRFQLGIPSVTVDGESIREFRLLITGLMDRVESMAKDTSVWWAEEKTRNRRIALLKPYNLRFHQDENQNIQLIFFNGRYAPYYRDFMRTLARVESNEESQEWVRGYTCSHCQARRDAASARRADEAPASSPASAPRLTGFRRESNRADGGSSQDR